MHWTDTSAVGSVRQGVVYLGVFPTAVAFTTWACALSRTSASKMGATTYLVPALTVLLSWAIPGQVPGLLALAGGTLCLVGVALSRRPSGTPAVRGFWRAERWPLGMPRGTDRPARAGGSGRPPRRV
jgi:drug/metabolite transporter (DMT)-like permease